MPKERTGEFVSWADTRLRYRIIEPDSEPVGTFVYVHGYAEHSGRYPELTSPVASSGWRCAGFDMRGHGGSEGLRGYMLRFRHNIYDVDAFLRHLESLEIGGPIVLYGHSAGAAAAFRCAAEHQDRVDGLIVSSMYLKNGEPVSPLLLAAAHLLNAFVPTLAIKPHSHHYLTRERSAIAAFEADPLSYTGNVRIRTGLELQTNYSKVLSLAPSLKLPVLMLHGTGDLIADPEPTREVYELCGSEDKKLITYDGCYHELIHDLDSEQVIADIVGWLKRFIEGRTGSSSE